MNTRRLFTMLLSCALLLGCTTPRARASCAPNAGILSMDDLKAEWIDPSTVEYLETNGILRTRTTVDGDYSAQSIVAVTRSISLRNGSVVTFDCSYSPSSASMDFGVITSSGRFYSINGREGSINQAIEISQAGSYQVAIRNNSSQTVSVTGFVDY